LDKAKRLWANLNLELGEEALMKAKVIFLGDYCDRGPNTKGMLDWLINLKKERDNAKAETVFVAGNHDFAFAAYLGNHCIPTDCIDQTVDMDSATNEGKWGGGYLTAKIEGGMHYQGRRWGGSNTYNARETFKSYGAKFGYMDDKAREGLLPRVPQSHRDFLRSLEWVHDCKVAFKPYRLLAVHAGLNNEGKLEPQLKALKKRDIFADALLSQKGRFYAFSERDKVSGMHPELKDKAYLVSGHHGYREVTADGLRIICDKSGGIPSQPLEAVILPSGKFISDAPQPRLSREPSLTPRTTLATTTMMTPPPNNPEHKADPQLRHLQFDSGRSRGATSSNHRAEPLRNSTKKKRGRFEALTDDGTPSWPLGESTSHDYKQALIAGKRPCMLLSTGAYSPIHKGHVDIMVRAHEAMAKEFGYYVLGGWISPSSDFYVGPKAVRKSQAFAEAAHRVRCAQIAVQAIPWLHIATWEARQRGGWPDYPVVVSAAAKFINSQSFVDPKVPITVMYVCGTDHAVYAGRGFRKANQGVCVVPRAGQQPWDTTESKLVYGISAVNQNVAGYSSTAARNAIQGHHYSKVAEMLGDRVLRYLTEHQLYGIPPVHVFISCSKLAPDWKLVPKHIMDRALFFFGSKRKWLFPGNNPDDIREQQRQPGRYHLMDKAFVELVREKEQKGQVWFLKDDNLDYKGYPGPKDQKAYARASEWFAKTAGMGKFILDPSWWRDPKRVFKYVRSAEMVVKNFEAGFHEYNAVQELLYQSYGGRIKAVLVPLGASAADRQTSNQ